MILARPGADEDVLFYGTSEYATKEQTLKIFFSRKTKKGQCLKKNSSDKRQALIFFFERFKKGFCLNKDFIPSRIFERFKKKPKKTNNNINII